MQLNDLLKVAEDVFDVCRREDGVSDQRLVKQILQNLHQSNVCSLCVEQLCEIKTGRRDVVTQDGLHLFTASQVCVGTNHTLSWDKIREYIFSSNFFFDMQLYNKIFTKIYM